MHEVLRVDLRDAQSADPAVRDRFRAALRGGLMDTGFVRVAGNGIDPGLITHAHAAFERFFGLPHAEKLRTGGVAGGQRGYTPFGVEHARDSSIPDQKEFFHVGQRVAASSPLRDVYPPNVWPDAVPELEACATALYRALERVAGALLSEIELAFGIRPDSLASMIVDGNSILRAAHYPPLPEDVDPRAMRAAPHEDINLITLLCDATDEGLELLDRSGTWVGVPSRPDELVADVGDMLARLTNGHLPATTHRVVARGPAARRPRHALPFFAHPRPECDLSVMSAFIANNEAPRFAPITAQAFLTERLREIGLVS